MLTSAALVASFTHYFGVVKLNNLSGKSRCD
jgi:hypothetical protein